MTDSGSSPRRGWWRLVAACVFVAVGVLVVFSVILSAQERDDRDDAALPPPAPAPSACQRAAPVDLPELEVSPDTPFDVSAPKSLPDDCGRLALEIFPASRGEVAQTGERRWRASLPSGIYDYELLLGGKPQGGQDSRALSLGRGSIYVTDNQEAVLLHDGLSSMMESVDVTAADQPRGLHRGERADFLLDISIPPIATSPQTDRVVAVTTCTQARGADLEGPECTERSITVGSGDRWHQPVTLVAGEADRIAVNVEVQAEAQVGDVDLRTSTATALPSIEVSTTLWQRASAGWSGVVGFLGGIMTLVGAVGGVRELSQRVRKPAQSPEPDTGTA